MAGYRFEPMKISNPAFVRYNLVTLLAGIVLLTGPSGCKRNEQAAPAPQPAVHNAPTAFSGAAVAPATAPAASATDTPERQRERAWMRAIFGQAYAPGKDEALAELDVDGAMEYHRMALASASALPDGRVAVLVNGSPSDQDGNDLAGHGSPGVLNVYLLRANEGGWQVLERHENLSSMGSHGNIGSIEWIIPSAGKAGFIVTSGGTWQGYSIAVANIFELGSPIRELGDLLIGSTNEGACVPDTECWDVNGSIRFADRLDADTPPDMLVDFSGKRYRVIENQPDKYSERLDSTIKETARYRFDGKAYVLTEGVNPVPEV